MRSFQVKRVEEFKIIIEKLLGSESGGLIELIVDVERITSNKT